MKKRGVKKRSGKAASKAAAKRKPAKKNRPKTRPKKAVQSNAGSRRSGSKGSSRKESFIRKEERLLKKEERIVEQDVKKEVRWLLSPEEFHVVTFVACLIILAFLLHSTSLVFYSVLTLGALAFAHFMRQHHRPHDVLTILGVFFLPLLLTIGAFRDWLVWLLLAVYVISAISTTIIYYMHNKAHSILKIMWQVTYSRIIAITAGMILACLIPLVLPDTFFSIFELIFVFALPVSLVFFFMSKFFYLYFFDRKHIRHDTWLSFKHALIYALAFIVILMGVYAVFASAFYNSRMDEYDADLDIALIGVSELETGVNDLPRDTRELMVVKDVSGFATFLRTELSDEKDRLANHRLSFADIVDDSYFDAMGDNAFNVMRFVVLQQELGAMREIVLDTKEDIDEFYARFEDPDGSMLKNHAAEMKADLDVRFVPYSQDADVRAVMSAVDDPYTDFSFFEENGLFFWFAEEAGLDFVYHSESIFGKQMADMLKHSRPMRTLAELTIKSIVFLDAEASSTSAVEYLYSNRDADLTPISRAVRYSMIKADLDARESREKETRMIDFKVD